MTRDIYVPRHDLAPVRMYWVTRPLTVSTEVYAGPGKATHTTIKLPEMVYHESQIPELPSKWRIVDFLWLLTPGGADTRIPEVDTYVEDLEEMGVIDYYSYAGCRVEIRSPYINWPYEYGAWLLSTALHTGIPFYIDLSPVGGGVAHY